MTGRLRVAVLGAGMIGEVHRRAALLAGAELVGAMASTPERSREVADRWGAPRAFASVEEVADSDVDVVHVATPNAAHVPTAVALAAAGKHVVCEKPLGTSSEQAQRALDAAEAAGVVTAVPFVYRFHPMAREMRARVLGGDLGAVNLVHGSYLQDWLLDPRATSWRVDPAQGGPSRAFADIGSHWCDLAEWVTGDRIEALVATTSISVPRRPAATAASSSAAPTATFNATSGDAPLVDVTTEDSAVVLFRTAGGVAGSVTVSQLSAGRKNRLWLEVDGARRSAVFDQEDPEHLWIGGDEGGLVLNRDPNRGSAEQRRLATLPAGHAQGYAQCFEAFVADTYAAVRARGSAGGGAAPEGLPTFADGVRSALVVDAVVASARTGAWTTVGAPATP